MVTETYRIVPLFLGPPYNFFKYLKEFDQFLKNNPEIPSLILTYEDLFHEPHKQVRRLAEFVGKDCSDQEIAEAVKACSFDNMKEADAYFKEEFMMSKSKDGESSIFRKGLLGFLWPCT